MFVDARSLPSETVVHSSLCIIGAGAAGITLAIQSAKTGRPVCLIEGGGFESDEGSRALYAGHTTGQHYGDLDIVRLRYFGGTTNHWAGYCRTLDPNDFSVRPWIPHSGWPFDRSHLDPYYVKAAAVCELASETFDPETWSHRSGLGMLPVDSQRIIQRITQFSPPTRFGTAYREEVGSTPNLMAYLHANLIQLATDESGQRIVRADLATITGVRFTVVARQYVLACGGIENPRLLLLSSLGNDHDLVGRYFMEHTNLPRTARMLLRPEASAQMPFYQVQAPDGGRTVQGGLGLSPAVQEREEVGNVAAWLEPYASVENPGVRALREMAGVMRTRQLPDDLEQHVQTMLVNAQEVTKAILQQVYNETPFQIRTVSEQVPNPNSRVTLTDDVDSLGLRRANLHWELTDVDKRSITRTVAVLAMELGRLGLGRVRLELDEGETVWPDPTWWGHHHMGTTRMHQDPNQGVVDADCRVHGMANLFVAGSSVFPTSGSAGPTLTIVALALRLADYLDQEARR